MLIDWFTVGAQALNFIILVWLMKRFLYKPILEAIDAREKRIAAALADADAKKAEAQRERDDFQHRTDEFERQRASLLDQATKDAEAERHRLLEEARQAADALGARRQEALLGDARRLNQALVRRTQQEVIAIARMALADLATASLEERIAEVFGRRLRGLDGPAKERIGRALAAGTGPVLVRSAFKLPAEQRAAIQSAVNETFAADIALQFETVPDLVGGIELSANGQKVAWSVADYLDSLQKAVNELTQPQPQAQPQSQSMVEPGSP
jgi:F-type H+-transporting ATPase subunit b